MATSTSPTKADEGTKPPEITPTDEWRVQGPHGLQRRDDAAGTPVVRLAEVVRWLQSSKEMALGEAVRHVAGALRESQGVELCHVNSAERAEPAGVNPFDSLLLSEEEMKRCPLQRNTRRIADRIAKTWLVLPHVLASLVNTPGSSSEYDERAETPFEFFERMGQEETCAAVDFATAHALWGWGTLAQPVAEAAHVSPFPLADFEALVAYRKAQKQANAAEGKPRKNVSWDVGNQLAVLHAEHKRLGSNTAAAELIAKALGTSRQAVDHALLKEWTPRMDGLFRGANAA